MSHSMIDLVGSDSDSEDLIIDERALYAECVSAIKILDLEAKLREASRVIDRQSLAIIHLTEALRVSKIPRKVTRGLAQDKKKAEQDQLKAFYAAKRAEAALVTAPVVVDIVEPPRVPTPPPPPPPRPVVVHSPSPQNSPEKLLFGRTVVQMAAQAVANRKRKADQDSRAVTEAKAREQFFRSFF